MVQSYGVSSVMTVTRDKSPDRPWRTFTRRCVGTWTSSSPPSSWTFRISSGVSQGIDKSVVQSDWEFLRIGVDGRR